MRMMLQQGNHAFYAPSLAYTVGNVTFKTVHMLKNLFGPKFFRYIHIDTRMAFTEFAKNTNKEYIHKNRPILGIKPVVDIDNDDIFLKESLLTTNKFPMHFDSFGGSGNSNFMPLFRDLEKRNSVGYLLDRIRVAFGVFMDFDTVVEQMNIYRVLRSMLHDNEQYIKRTAIEIHIPRALMQMISVDSGVPMVDESGSVEKFLSYLNKNSCKPITYQMKPSSGTDEFFVYYPLNIEYTPTDFSMESVNKVGSASLSAPITFTFTAEFNSIQMFDYAPPRGVPLNFDRYDISISTTSGPSELNGNIIIPVMTFDNMFEERNSDGWRFFTTRMFRVDHEEGMTEDHTDLSSIFKNTNIKEAIDYHNLHGLDNHLFINFRVWAVDVELKEGRDFEVDYKTLTLIVKKLNKRMTYRFSIYVNDEYLNDLMIRIRPEEFEMG